MNFPNESTQSNTIKTCTDPHAVRYWRVRTLHVYTKETQSGPGNTRYLRVISRFQRLGSIFMTNSGTWTNWGNMVLFTVLVLGISYWIIHALAHLWLYTKGWDLYIVKPRRYWVRYLGGERMTHWMWQAFRVQWADDRANRRDKDAV